LDHQAKYWTRYLTAKIPVSQIPGDDATGVTEIEPSRIFQLKLSPRLTAKLQETASRENTTLFVTMLAILKTWIAIIANQTMITVGTVFSGRTYPELEKIPGIMMNLLPLRLDLSGNPDCSQILSRTRQVVLEAYNNQDYSLDLAAHKMRKVINLNRDIYSIMFIGQESLDSKVHFDGLKISSCPLVKIISGQNNKDDDGFFDCDYHLQQDLLIEMLAEKNQIYLLIRYNNRRFCSQTIKRYFDHFKSIVEQFLDPINPRLSHLQSFKICEPDELF
jgi:fengycin family lipopeptide synthetase D